MEGLALQGVGVPGRHRDDSGTQTPSGFETLPKPCTGGEVGVGGCLKVVGPPGFLLTITGDVSGPAGHPTQAIQT